MSHDAYLDEPVEDVQWMLAFEDLEARIAADRAERAARLARRG